jgi:hypothetical protein
MFDILNFYDKFQYDQIFFVLMYINLLNFHDFKISILLYQIFYITLYLVLINRYLEFHITTNFF